MGRALEILDSTGEEAILSRIMGGDAQAEVARSLGVSNASMCEWLHATPERSARAREAMKASAESWLDRGLQALLEAEPEASEIARARAIEQHCARRAAVRDPARYGDRTTLAGDPSAPLASSVSPETISALARMTPDQLRALASKPLKDGD